VKRRGGSAFSEVGAKRTERCARRSVKRQHWCPHTGHDPLSSEVFAGIGWMVVDKRTYRRKATTFDGPISSTLSGATPLGVGEGRGFGLYLGRSATAALARGARASSTSA